MIRVLMVDDQVILRESLKFIIEKDSEIQVVGCASNGIEAYKMCEKLMPDLVLMDIMMPVSDGVEGTKLIKSKEWNIKILILTTFDDEENIAKALKNGADGYILKDIRPEELILAIKSVAKGLGIMHQNALDIMKKQISHLKGAEASSENLPELGLTQREVLIIRLIVSGKSNKDIASELHLTEGSVKNIITAIQKKLSLKDRIQLVIFAVKNKIV